MRTYHLFQKITFIVSLLVSLSLLASAQKSLVTGKVITDKDDQPLPGVTIIIKNTSIGTVSNVSGEFSIQAQIGDTLVFSFIGLQTRLVKVEKTKLLVKLHGDQNQLEEVVVSGYHTVKKEAFVGSCVTVKGNSLQRRADYYSNTEEYNSFSQNQFRKALDAPLSTFSIDVDVASYSNMRRFINNGQIPPADAIRTEELLNYFTYDYPAPRGNDPVSITTEVSAAPWNPQHRLVHIGIKAKEIAMENLPASNLVFLIDVSGSMSDQNKLPLLKSSLKMLVQKLRPQDRVAIVTYANHTKELLPSTSCEDKQKIISVIESLYASGGTAGGDGVQRAYRVAEASFIKNGNNRIILATDGDFNIGLSSPQELEKLIETKRSSGIYLTVLGFGMGNYKDNRVQTLAEKGNGNHAYIDNLTEAKKVLVSEFGGTLFTVAKDVKIQVEFNPAKVQAYRLIGYESRLLEDKDFNDDTKDAGEMGAGHSVTALYEVIPVGVKSNLLGDIDPLKYQKTEKKEKKSLTDSPELLTLKLRYKQPDSDKSSKMEVAVIDKNTSLNNVSENFRFSAAVAGFGMLLQDSKYKNDLTYDDVIHLAREATQYDPEGYRKEFIRLVESAALLK
ncbi:MULTISPECIES: vWA domain-containing protein [Butyricimonas]|uniref:vWA domain-containing protein n=1 Tax=Butyricimonas TaxID=574697 RepID=UPI001D08A08F|nr:MULTISPECIES: VWA domain-containing protein [Butyricimonas]MCB6972259.1 von Willebrand factor type A domain-containing protein [Butyricimonas synergistica]MCG4519178.1 von Willebrand factor type A domain-containing protein [Butyricimonas sp. DFI.6.44]